MIENRFCSHCGGPPRGYIQGRVCALCLDARFDYERPERWRAVQRCRLQLFVDTFKELSRVNVLVRLESVIKLTIAEFIVRMRA